MLSNAMVNIYVRVFLRRMADGETLDEIFESYPKLTAEERQQIIDKLKIIDKLNAI